MPFLLPYLFLILQLLQRVNCYNFPYESIQLSDADVRNSSDLAFGNNNNFGQYVNQTRPRCKAYPGDATWPSAVQWATLNSSLGGALIKGAPPAAVCYPGPTYDADRCAYVRSHWFNSTFFTADPTSQMEQWQTGNNCPLPPANSTTNLTCNAIAQPVYTVNATTVKHLQLAVNFARNNNLRVVIKNTGHDFIGRSAGGGALNIWTHHLKNSQYLPSARIGEYRGRAMRMGSAMEAWEVYRLMGKHNITLIAPISSTVGAYGGFMQGGGHSLLTSYYGFMADQVLSLEVVTADGRFVHAGPDENDDLFFAIRGGGGGNFGIVTSVVVKAYPVLPISVPSVTFSAGLSFIGPSVSNETFWTGVRTYFSHVIRICNAKGLGFNYISSFTLPPFSPFSNSSSRILSFQGSAMLPGMSPNQSMSFIAPLIADLNKVGINVSNQAPVYYPSYSAYGDRPPGEGVGNGRFGSRLFPRTSFEDPNSDTFADTMAAIREFVEEGGYSFHSVNYSPSEDTAPDPGNNAVNPALRKAIAHATGFDSGDYGPYSTSAEQIASHRRLTQYLQKWRDVSPGAGAYMNEADTQEPDWQQSFYGENYERLSAIKKRRDPWSLFHTVTGVGSEEWEVEGANGLPVQNGRLCRTEES
ncbi:FAD/FMN-containing isoamyl alcohol oxidase-like protein MreA [Glonium stellatum]|uniref:FAD/FMN-containing isoamyl alcohol oxidase-like protein MreA n=1 Tax=Glonium stellatum TaxID=574774 RepID=A0A8E2EUW2_9PEZI|nr:FAD/FMN-containing isoamyl alcohol oxidase-like protein MreA [Glonium stellatum]